MIKTLTWGPSWGRNETRAEMGAEVAGSLGLCGRLWAKPETDGRRVVYGYPLCAGLGLVKVGTKYLGKTLYHQAF